MTFAEPRISGRIWVWVDSNWNPALDSAVANCRVLENRRRRNSGVERITSIAAEAAANVAGGRPVEKIKLRARLIRRSINVRPPATYPPNPPMALLSVPIWIMFRFSSPKCSTAPPPFCLKRQSYVLHLQLRLRCTSQPSGKFQAAAQCCHPY